MQAEIQDFPHARGGEPYVTIEQEGLRAIFPTRVGLNRNVATARCLNFDFPHARGGEPIEEVAISFDFAFSPRAWG